MNTRYKTYMVIVYKINFWTNYVNVNINYNRKAWLEKTLFFYQDFESGEQPTSFFVNYPKSTQIKFRYKFKKQKFDEICSSKVLYIPKKIHKGQIFFNGTDQMKQRI